MGQLHADEHDIRPNQPIYGNKNNNHIKWVPAESLTDKKKRFSNEYYSTKRTFHNLYRHMLPFTEKDKYCPIYHVHT